MCAHATHLRNRAYKRIMQFAITAATVAVVAIGLLGRVVVATVAVVAVGLLVRVRVMFVHTADSCAHHTAANKCKNETKHTVLQEKDGRRWVQQPHLVYAKNNRNFGGERAKDHPDTKNVSFGER